MPGFNNADQSYFETLSVRPGRRIYVDPVNGSNTVGVGDGSSPRPYLTIARAVQDLRNRRGDIVVVRGDPTENASVIISGVNGFGIVGTRSNWTAGNSSIQRPISSASGPGNFISYTFGASHGFSSGDLVVMYGGEGDIGTRPNGVGVVRNALATTLDVEPPAKGATFPNLTEPLFMRAALQISACSEFFIHGMFFGGSSLFTDTAAALVLRNCGAPRIVNCSFGTGALAIAAGTSPADLIEFGRGNLVEHCDFIPTSISGLTPRRGEAPGIMLQGASDFRFLNNNFFPTTTDAVFSPIAWEALGGDGYIHIATNPVLGALFAGNTFANKFDSPLGSGGYTSLVHLDDPAASNGLERVFFRGNFYQGATTGSPVPVDDEQGMQDDSPAVVIGQDNLPTWENLVWGQRLQDAIGVTGSMGETVARLAYLGGVHVDSVSGTAGQTIGINGLPENPVTTEADARAIANALGFTKYFVRNVLLLTGQEHVAWEFEGMNPEQDVVTVSGVDVSRSSFELLGIRGEFLSSPSGVVAERCLVGESGGTVSGLQGIFNVCNFLGTVVPASGQQLVTVDPSSSSVPAGTVIDFAGLPATVLMRNVAGIFVVRNVDDSSSVFGATLAGAELFLESSITAGIFQLGGYGQVSDSKTSATAFINNILFGSRLDIAVSSRASGADLLALSGVLDGIVRRNFGGNTRTQLFFADAAITGRGVPAGSVSHMRVETRDDDAGPLDQVHFVWFSYKSGAVATDAPATSQVSGVAPTDGTFTSVPFPS